jgi:hypothetical protein
VTKPSRKELRDLLNAAARPEPRPAFVERLAARLRAVDNAETVVVVDHAPERPRRWRVALPAVAATAVLAVVLVQATDTNDPARLDQAGSARQPETGEPTTTTAAPTTSTLPPGPTTTVAVTRPAPVAPAPAPDRRPQSTTTTAKARVEPLRLSCAGSSEGGQPTITCRWSQPESRGVAQSRLWRERDGAKRVLATVGADATQYVDRTVERGGSYQYLVEALDAEGRVVARSAAVRTVCCGAAPARV